MHNRADVFPKFHTQFFFPVVINTSLSLVLLHDAIHATIGDHIDNIVIFRYNASLYFLKILSARETLILLSRLRNIRIWFPRLFFDEKIITITSPVSHLDF